MDREEAVARAKNVRHVLKTGDRITITGDGEVPDGLVEGSEGNLMAYQGERTWSAEFRDSPFVYHMVHEDDFVLSSEYPQYLDSLDVTSLTFDVDEELLA